MPERNDHQGIVARGVRRAFGDVVAVDHIDLDAPPGEVTALVGPNGAGKTTLLLVLATLLVPDAGTVSIAGHDPVTEPRAVRARVGWMPDVFGTWETLTCREVLRTVSDAFRLPRSVSGPRIDELLALVHLTELADRPTQVLSRGQKQRLGLARALVHDPDVLLLDEPASGLDPRSRIELRGIVRGLAAQGKAVLVSSHVLAELDEMADRAVIVARGRTVATEVLGEGSPGALYGRPGTAGATAAGVPGQTRTWRVRALDADALQAALRGFERRAEPAGRDTVEVQVASDADAADLLADLVGAGVRVVAFQPSAGALEQAYLALTEDRR
ncbi:MAG TPA: ABC transporter ATP-binding protein [Kineosporiaceae bacterium]|nr:ABC transporter ATP-binding protein [Kineosporiaceae bacterium]